MNTSDIIDPEPQRTNANGLRSADVRASGTGFSDVRASGARTTDSSEPDPDPGSTAASAPEAPGPRPSKHARLRLVVGIPLLIILIASVPQGIRVAQRVDDGDFGARTVVGNGVTLVWAPRGPGWPDTGTTWDEAREICRYLSEDGTTIMEEEQNIWRLPTVDEAVRSMMLHGENAGGTWDPETGRTTYEKTPDKESPLWDIHSKVIYYWTAESSGTDGTRAYIIVYHGGIFEKQKTDGQDYLTFRAVKDEPE